MVRKTGYAPSTIHRILQSFSLQPNQGKTFKHSADPYLVDKTGDRVNSKVPIWL